MRAEQTFAVTTKHDAYQSINRSLTPQPHSSLDRQSKKKKQMDHFWPRNKNNNPILVQNCGIQQSYKSHIISSHHSPFKLSDEDGREKET